MTSRFAEIIPRTTVEGTVSRLQSSDGLILEISPRLGGHLARFAAVQTHPSCRFHLAAEGQRRPWLTVEALKELLAARQK